MMSSAQARPGRARPRLGAAARLGLVVLLLGVTHALWLPAIGGFLIIADPLRPADALVPLGGGSVRVVEAARLYARGYATWLVTANMPLDAPGIRETYGELVRREAIWQGVPAERIVIAPGVVETTYQEALAIRQAALQRGWRSLIAVTDPYHARRTRMCFQSAFRGTGITIIVRPVEHSGYRADSWWRTQDGLRDTWTEYLKLALYLVGYR